MLGFVYDWVMIFKDMVDKGSDEMIFFQFSWIIYLLFRLFFFEFCLRAFSFGLVNIETN